MSEKQFTREKKCLAVILVSLFAPATASAQLLYCCEVKGKRSCSDALPNQCIGYPYTVRGPGGKLIKSVEAPLTPEQLKAKQEAEKRKVIEEETRKEQARIDAALLATYSSEAEIDKGRERAESEILSAISAAETKVAAAEKKKSTAIGDPELYKKRGMPEDLKRKVQDIDFEIRTLTDLINDKKRDLDAVRTKYTDDKNRYLELKTRSSGKR